MDCPICLDVIKGNQSKIKLTCDHELHYKCFLLCVIKTDGNIFIKCPLCRTMNYDNRRPHQTDILNLKELSKIGRCSHSTREGKRCKKKSHILNYGYCSIHSTNILPKEKYSLICDYIFHLFETNGSRRSKLYMIDLAKKILIKYPSTETIQGILHYFFRYYHYNNKVNIVNNSNEVYNYYELDPPPENWVQKCQRENLIL